MGIGLICKVILTNLLQLGLGQRRDRIQYFYKKYLRILIGKLSNHFEFQNDYVLFNYSQIKNKSVFLCRKDCCPRGEGQEAGRAGREGRLHCLLG